MTLVKICGITNVEDALASVSFGANMLGFVFADSPRRVDVQTVKHIQRILGGDVKTVGVFVDESEEVLSIINECNLNYVQLHGKQSEEFAARIGAEKVIRATRVRDESSITALASYQVAAFYLLDTYKEGIAGGTGETFDWKLAISAKELGKPLILSGGLSPNNVGDAIRTIRPFAVDASSALEQSPGRKDHLKIKEFIGHVREADSVS